jgi:hypothetical protein
MSLKLRIPGYLSWATVLMRRSGGLRSQFTGALTPSSGRAAMMVGPVIRESRTMAQGWRVQPLFITSTFRDLHAERDYLRDRVFPVLEERLRERRCYLEPIDVCWLSPLGLGGCSTLVRRGPGISALGKLIPAGQPGDQPVGARSVDQGQGLPPVGLAVLRGNTLSG